MATCVGSSVTKRTHTSLIVPSLSLCVVISARGERRIGVASNFAKQLYNKNTKNTVSLVQARMEEIESFLG